MRTEDRKTKAQLLGRGGREIRRVATGFECRDAGDGMLRVRGVASSTESPYDMRFYTETIARGAFAKTLSERPDVQLLINHEGLPLARSTVAPGTAGSLRLWEDEVGLNFEALLDGGDADARTVVRKIKAGLMDECSFSFRVVRQEWSADYEERRIVEVNLDRGDVSVVNFGANANTPVMARKRPDGGRDIDLYRARAFALKLAGRTRRTSPTNEKVD